MGKKKSSAPSSNLGRSIIKNRFAKTQRNPNNFLHTTELPDGVDWARLNLQSVTEQSNLDDFLATAEMAQTEFTAEKTNVTVIESPIGPHLLPSLEARLAVVRDQKQHLERLTIPRRPGWDETTTAEELDQLERESFLEWRRDLGHLKDEKNVILTPYEKNLEFWKQLWRVIERSDLVVQIVDARNPLLFYCEDLVKYVKEVNTQKQNLVLINKADFLTAQQRQFWSKYFTNVGVKVIFWSATQESAKLKNIDKEDDFIALNSNQSDSSDESDISDTPHDTRDKGVPDFQGDNRVDKSTDDHITNENMDESKSKEKLMDENYKNITAKEGDPNLDTLNQTDSDEYETETESEIDETNIELASLKLTESQNTMEKNSRNISNSNNEKAVDNAEINNRSRTSGLHDYSKPDGQNSAVTDNVDTSTVSANFELSQNLLTVEELLDVFRNLCYANENGTQELSTIGMVGYPNVGKSSTINAIMKKKKVPVSATPGRTKHFQTLYVDEDLMLCDCPGLVFPSFVTSKAELIVNGILPIDQMREHIAPISLVCERIPRNILCTIYGIMLPLPPNTEDINRPPTADEFLSSYALMRGYMTHKGLPDGPRASRRILKDYVNGKLVYCHPPPSIDSTLYDPTATSLSFLQSIHKPLKDDKQIVKKKEDAQQRVDTDFFQEKTQRAHVMGYNKDAVVGGTVPIKVASRPSEKPWMQKDKKLHKKREKLRRVYRHLDEH